jgi:hypothetical protein
MLVGLLWLSVAVAARDERQAEEKKHKEAMAETYTILRNIISTSGGLVGSNNYLLIVIPIGSIDKTVKVYHDCPVIVYPLLLAEVRYSENADPVNSKKKA